MKTEREVNPCRSFSSVLAGLVLVLGLGFPAAAQAQAKLKVGILHIGSITDARVQPGPCRRRRRS